MHAFLFFQATHGAEDPPKVVCKGNAADVVGQMRLELVFFGDAGVDVFASSFVQPSQEGLRKEKKWGEGLGLRVMGLPGWCLSLLVFDPCRNLKKAWLWHFIFDSIYGVSRESEVKYFPEHAIVVL